MSEVEFTTYEGEYGQRLGLHFGYDERLVDAMRELREDEHWQVTHCKPVYEDDDFDHWAVDLDEESIDRLESVAGIAVPDSVVPWQRGGDEVVLRVPEGRTRFFVEGGGDEVDSVLDMMLSYDNPDAKHSMAADPVIRIYNRSSRSAPMGLARKAAASLRGMGHEVSVEVEGDRSGPGISGEIDWSFPHTLRDYQRSAVQAVLDEGGGIVSLPTGAGKTIVALGCIRAIGQRAVVFVHTKELLRQWADEIRRTLDLEPGVIGDGEWSTGPVTVATMQTLLSRGTDGLGDLGVAIFDECHRTGAADTMHDLGLRIDPAYRIGLSATPWRRISGAEMKIEGAVGGVVSEVSAEELIDEGFLTEPRFEKLGHDGPTAARDEEYHEAYRRCVEESTARNSAVAARAAELADDGYRVLVNVDRVSQGGELAELADARGVDSWFLSGSDPTEVRDEVLSAFAGSDGSVLVSTLIKEGVDVPELDAVILAHAGKSDISVLQVVGRAMRPDADKDHCVVVDVADTGRFFGAAHRDRWDTMADYYGSYGPGGEDGLASDPPTLDDVR